MSEQWRGQMKLPRRNYRGIGLDKRQQRGRRRREARAIVHAIAAAAEFRAREERGEALAWCGCTWAALEVEPRCKHYADDEPRSSPASAPAAPGTAAT